MKKLKCLLLFLILSFSIGTEVYAQVSKQDAIDLVFDSIIMNRVDSVNVYMEPAIQNCEYYVMSPYDSIQSPYNSFWLFFIDENPEYDWGHNCEHVLIDSYSRSHWSVKRRLPPLRYLSFRGIISSSKVE